MGHTEISPSTSRGISRQVPVAFQVGDGAGNGALEASLSEVDAVQGEGIFAGGHGGVVDAGLGAVDEITDKMSICMANGCVSFWIVDPKRKRVSVTEGDVTKHYGVVASISCLLPAEEVRVGEIFGC